MNIVFFEVEDLEAGILLELYGDIDYDRVKEPLTNANVEKYRDVEIISTFIYSDLKRPVLQQLPKLKFITTRSRSFDHIDLDYCAEAGIAVSNVPSYGEHTVAEHVFALLLTLSRHIPEAAQRVKEGDFSLKGLQGFDLFGKTIGIIGTGAIGLHVAAIARGFGMRVLGDDIQPRLDKATEYGFTYVPRDELLRRSDIVSLHVAGEGRVIGEAELAGMRDGAVLINTSRGSAVDAKALLQALVSGKLLSVGLDVLPDEPAIRDDAAFFRESWDKHGAEAVLTSHALLRHKNVLITPHAAFYTKETSRDILKTSGDSIEAFLRGELLNTARPLPLTEISPPS
jgi:D-lactate dehydrogenase